jgi:hypothetical protein
MASVQEGRRSEVIIIDTRALTEFLVVVLLAGSLFAAYPILMSLVAEAADPGDVLISEVLYDCPGGCNENGCEWVELYNDSGSSINLQNWEICDNNSCDTLPSYSLGVGESVVIAAVEADFSGCGYSCATGNIVYLGGNIGTGLNDTGDVVCILDESDNIIDQMNWEEPTIGGTSKCFSSLLWNPRVDDVQAGHSLERCPTNIDTNTAGDWQDQSSSNPCEVKPTAITLSSFTAYPIASQGSLLHWQWAVGLVLGGVAVARRSLGR